MESAPRSSWISDMDAADSPVAPGSVRSDVARALKEDIADGDRTASLIPVETQLETRVICRETAVLSGRPWFDETFRQLNPSTDISWQSADGDVIGAGTEVCRVRGQARSILSGERTALNFLQTLSGTASRAKQFVDAVAGTGTIILDTRKTLPGLRLAR